MCSLFQIWRQKYQVRTRKKNLKFITSFFFKFEIKLKPLQIKNLRDPTKKQSFSCFFVRYLKFFWPFLVWNGQLVLFSTIYKSVLLTSSSINLGISICRPQFCQFVFHWKLGWGYFRCFNAIPARMPMGALGWYAATNTQYPLSNASPGCQCRR